MYYQPGDLVQSPGKTFVYEVLSYPFCRLYWNNGKPEPNTIESAWCLKDPNRPEAGWAKRGANFLSYQVRVLGSEQAFDWTDRMNNPIATKTTTQSDTATVAA
jgi:hypothetical protein